MIRFFLHIVNMEATIIINDVIGQISETEKGFMLLDLVKFVESNRDASVFKVIITSDGGEVNEGYAIYDYLKSLPQKIHTVARETCASIATVIFMAGDVREVEPDAELMIHLPSGGISFATADEIANYAKNLKAAENRLISFYCDALDINSVAIQHLLERETFLNVEDCKLLGIDTNPMTAKQAEPFTAIFRRVLKKHKNE